MRAAIVFLVLCLSCGSDSASLEGSYQGEDVRLTLKSSGTEYRGQLTVNGTSYPVKAKASGTKLAGSFTVDGKSFELEAKLDGKSLSLISGGKTRALIKEQQSGSGNPLAPGAEKGEANPLATAGTPIPSTTAKLEDATPTLSGRYTGRIEGTATTVTLKQIGSELTGDVNSGGYVYKVRAAISGTSGSGTLNDTELGTNIDTDVRLTGNALVFTLKLPNQKSMEMRFVREGAKATATSNSERGQPSQPSQPSQSADSGSQANSPLVGTWSKTTSMAGGGASFASKEYLQLSASGQFQLGSGKAVAGGSGWSMGSGDGVEITAKGKWKTQGKSVLINEGTGWQPYARFYVEPGKLMFTFGDGSRQIWYRN